MAAVEEKVKTLLTPLGLHHLRDEIGVNPMCNRSGKFDKSETELSDPRLCKNCIKIYESKNKKR